MTERERWLVIEGYVAGVCAAKGHVLRNERMIEEAIIWLDDVVADGVTVEMVLDHEADEWAQG